MSVGCICLCLPSSRVFFIYRSHLYLRDIFVCRMLNGNNLTGSIPPQISALTAIGPTSVVRFSYVHSSVLKWGLSFPGRFLATASLVCSPKVCWNWLNCTVLQHAVLLKIHLVSVCHARVSLTLSRGLLFRYLPSNRLSGGELDQDSITCNQHSI